MIDINENEEDLAALGITIKDASAVGKDADDDDEDDEEVEEDEDEDSEDVEKAIDKVAAIHDPDAPLDGLAELDRMEKELEVAEIDVGDEEE
jgi:hypothetical protein